MKLEHGSSVLTMEYLLSSRTVVSTVMAPFELRAWRFLVPLLIVLWAFSPLGSQASLRIMWVEDAFSSSTQNLSYLNYDSNFGLRPLQASGAPVQITSVYNLFMSALTSNEAIKRGPQDQFGHVKIPLYADVRSGSINTNESIWHDVPLQDEQVVWSSLQGIPIKGIPQHGQSNFILNTAYVGASCNVTAETTSLWHAATLKNCTTNAMSAGSGMTMMTGTPSVSSTSYDGSSCWSGANLAIGAYNLSTFTNPLHYPTLVNFSSFNYWTKNYDASGRRIDDAKAVTRALCWLSTNYVEVNVTCEGQSCRSTRIRPSQHLSSKIQTLQASGRDVGYTNPMAGFGNYSSADLLTFFSHLVDSTVNRERLCTPVRCTRCQLENYILDPYQLYWGEASQPNSWTVDNKNFSDRFTQILNTFWLDSIANRAILGSLNNSIRAGYGTGNMMEGILSEGQDRSQDGYNIRQTQAGVRIPIKLMRCSVPWYLTLMLASLLLLLASITTIAVNMSCKSPDILTSFTSLLRYNQYADMPPHCSLDDSTDVAQHLQKTRVLFGNVRPGEDIGYATVAVTGRDAVVTKLERRKLYG